MSENIPESIPTSMDPRSQRPKKKRALSPTSAQAAQLALLLKNPERNVNTNMSKEKRLPPPPEIVANVQGSSAGAGSGEFHVYKASRRREYERLKMMDEALRKEKEKEEFDRKVDENKLKDNAKTAKNRAKRLKKMERAAAKEEQRMSGSPQVEEGTLKSISEGNEGDQDLGSKINVTKSESRKEDTGSNGVKASTSSSSDQNAGSKGIVVFDDD